jgi:hypothetical protein
MPRATAAPRPIWQKLLAADALWAAASMCIETHMASAAEEFDIERKFRDKLYQVAPISATDPLLSCRARAHLPRSY